MLEQTSIYVNYYGVVSNCCRDLGRQLAAVLYEFYRDTTAPLSRYRPIAAAAAAAVTSRAPAARDARCLRGGAAQWQAMSARRERVRCRARPGVDRLTGATKSRQAHCTEPGRAGRPGVVCGARLTPAGRPAERATERYILNTLTSSPVLYSSHAPLNSRTTYTCRRHATTRTLSYNYIGL